MARVTYEHRAPRRRSPEPENKGLRGSAKLIIVLLVVGAILYFISG